MTLAAETLAIRKRMVQEYPWIYRLKRDKRQCQGKGGNCHHPATWRYTHSNRAILFPHPHNRKDLTRFYCWLHLMWAIHGSMGEFDRVLRWAEDHEEKFKPYTDKLDKIRGNGHG